MAREFNRAIAACVDGFLDGHGWFYSYDRDEGMFYFGINLPERMKNIQFVIGIGENDYTVYAEAPIAADGDDEEEMQQMAEFICRANYALKAGNFELDFRDGGIRYKYYMNCHGILPTKQIVGESILLPAQMFRYYSRGMVQILFQGASAEEAIAACEGNTAALSDEEVDEAVSRMMDYLQEIEDETGNEE